MGVLVPEAIKDFHEFLFTNLSDPRAFHYPLGASPWPGLMLIGIYIYFALDFGPKFMENRPPYKVDRYLIVYDIFQIIANAIIFVMVLRRYSALGWQSLQCAPLVSYDDPSSSLEYHLTYAYFIIKLIDWLDTVFIVLRKKNNQISFLHLYHHAGVLALAWGGVKYFPGGNGGMLALLNTFVHVVMYSYYLCCTLGYKKAIQYKQYVTLLQMTQFVLLVLHALQLYLFQSCNYPRGAYASLTVPQYGFMLYLFSKFYVNTYMRKGKTSQEKVNGATTANNADKTNGLTASQKPKTA